MISAWPFDASIVPSVNEPILLQIGTSAWSTGQGMKVSTFGGQEVKS